MSAIPTGSGPDPFRKTSAPRVIAKVPRAHCHTCGGEVFLRGDDTFGEHRNFPADGGPSTLCDGGGQKRLREIVGVLNAPA